MIKGGEIFLLKIEDRLPRSSKVLFSISKEGYMLKCNHTVEIVLFLIGTPLTFVLHDLSFYFDQSMVHYGIPLIIKRCQNRNMFRYYSEIMGYSGKDIKWIKILVQFEV